MALGMPTIDVTFKQLAATAVTRSSRGILALVVRDNTEGTAEIAEYTTYLDIPEDAYTKENMIMITRAFTGGPAKVIIVKQVEDSSTTELSKALDQIFFNWLVIATEASADQEAAVAYVQNRNKKKQARQVKALVYNVATADDIHIVRFMTETAVMNDEEKTEVEGWELLSRMGGVLAGMPMTRSTTYYEMKDILNVTEPEELDEAVDNGDLFLFNDEGTVRISRAVNSLITTGANLTEDMKSIAIVEAMDLMREDIFTTFKNDYLGRYKNSYDNQCLFIAAVNGYFKDLGKEEILDGNYKNIASVDIEAQRDAWLANGTQEAADWDEQTVKNNTFKRKVFLAGNVKILDAMEDLFFPIIMM